MNLDTMMTDALTRRDARHAEVGRVNEERRAEELSRWMDHCEEIFGADLLGKLGMLFGGTDYSTVARFCWHDKQYSLSEGRSSWYLVRKDPRDEDDDREQPNIECYAHFQNGQDNNGDSLLCALSDLAAKPDTAMRPSQRSYPPHEPSAAERLTDALRALIRNELSDWQGYEH